MSDEKANNYLLFVQCTCFINLFKTLKCCVHLFISVYILNTPDTGVIFISVKLSIISIIYR